MNPIKTQMIHNIIQDIEIVVWESIRKTRIICQQNQHHKD
jgi:hypothetical protein